MSSPNLYWNLLKSKYYYYYYYEPFIKIDLSGLLNLDEDDN